MTQGTWATGGFKEGDATHAPGMYEFGIPNAAIAAGVRWVDLYFMGATNMAPVPMRIMIKAVDLQDGVRAGLTALPNAAAGATGGLDLPVVRGATAQAGTVNSITLDASASATNNLYNGLLVHIVSSTGAGQVRTITGYNGTTKIATVDRPFITAPAGTSVFELLVGDSPALNANLQVTSNVARVTIRSATAQTGSTSTTIKLDSSASATNNLYNGDLVTITGGTGVGQTRTIISYVGSTKVATIDKAWVTTPDNTSTFDIYASTTPSVFSDQGVAQAGGATSITLASTASATTSVYVGSIVTILAGTGSGQTREITAYNGSTKVATVDSAWSANPDTTSVYAVIPTASGIGSTSGVQDANVISVNDVPASSVTAVNANQGTTQPVNYTGTGASALVKTDVIDWASAAVSALINLIVNTGTASAGGASTITLTGTPSSVDSFYNGALVVILSGTGVGQTRRILSYVGSTGVATVERAWQTNPDNTSVYAVVADSGNAVNSSLQAQSDVRAILGTTSAGAAGKVAIDPAQALSNTQTAQTVGDCLVGARAQAYGKWAIVGTTLSIYASDGTTVLKSFTLDSASAPTSRT